MILTLLFDATSKLGIGSARYVDFEPKLAANEAECSNDQFASPGKWKLANGSIVPATAADLKRPQAALVSDLVSAAKTASDAVTAQIATAETHIVAYQNAAAWAIAAGGAPTVDPGMSAFAAMATANGFSSPASFASLVLGLSAASMSLSAVLATLQGAAERAANASDLQTALSAFETSLAAEVAALNGAGLTTTIAAPAAIGIVGINE